MDIASVTTVVASAGVLVGVIFAYLEVRSLVRTRQTELVIGLYSQVTSKEWEEAYTKVLTTEFKDYDDFADKYGSLISSKPIPMALDRVCRFYEQLGILLHKKLIDIDLVYNLFSVTRPWTKVKPMVEGVRKQLSQPSLYEWFEYLYNEVQRKDMQAHAPQSQVSLQ